MEAKKKMIIIHAARVGQSGWQKIEDESKKRLKKPYQFIEDNNSITEESWVDPILTYAGQAQSDLIARNLESLMPKIKVILVSPCRRARETLKIILENLEKKKIIDRSNFKENVKIVSTPYLLPKVTDISDFPFEEKTSRKLLADFTDENFGFNIDELLEWEIGEGKFDYIWLLNFLKSFVPPSKLEKLTRIDNLINLFGEKETFDVKKFAKAFYSVNRTKFEGQIMILKRIEGFREFISENYGHLENGEILLIGHGGFLRRLFKLQKLKNGAVGSYYVKINVRKNDESNGFRVINNDDVPTMIGDEDDDDEFVDLGGSD